MAAVARGCSSASLGHCFEWASGVLPCVQSANQAFRRVVVEKLRENGEVRVYTQTDTETGRVRSYTQVPYLEEIATGDLYRDEPRSVIATKCALIMCGTPLFALTMEVWHLVKMSLLVSFIAIKTIQHVLQRLCEGEFREIGSICWSALGETGSALAEGIWEVASTPFYAIGVEFSALYGLIDQYRGRKWVAAIEHSWQKGVSYKEDRRRDGAAVARDPSEATCSSLFQDLKQGRLFYLANCFQVRGNTHDPRIRIVRSEAL